MIYASSKDELKKRLVGIACEIQGSDTGDVEYDEVRSTPRHPLPISSVHSDSVMHCESALSQSAVLDLACGFLWADENATMSARQRIFCIVRSLLELAAHDKASVRAHCENHY